MFLLERAKRLGFTRLDREPPSCHDPPGFLVAWHHQAAKQITSAHIYSSDHITIPRLAIRAYFKWAAKMPQRASFSTN
jgi:hypothetical protein